MINNTKYAGLDIAKFLCSIEILLYHFFSEHGPIHPIFEDILSLYAVCVALFMVISGFLLYNKIIYINIQKERWKIVKKQILRILQIYILWSIPYLIYNILKWDYSSISLSFIFWKIQGWVFRSTFFTIWFMPSLAFGLLISYLVIEKLPIQFVFVLAIFAYLLGSLNSTYSFVFKNWSMYENVHRFIDLWLNGARGQFLFGFPFVTLGYVIAKYKQNFCIKYSIIFAIISMIGLLSEALILRKSIGHTGIDLAIFMIPVIYFIMCFLISLKIRWIECYSYLRKMSVLIFMSQRLFLTVLPSFSTIRYSAFYNKQIGSFIIICGGTVLISLLIIKLSNKILFLKRLY